MVDGGLTAGLLEEHLLAIESKMPEDTVLLAAIRSAMRQLRETDENKPFTREEVEGFAGLLNSGVEIACYLESRKYYKPEGCVIYAIGGGEARMLTGIGRTVFALDSYGKRWRLWEKWPDGIKRRKYEWAK